MQLKPVCAACLMAGGLALAASTQAATTTYHFSELFGSKQPPLAGGFASLSVTPGLLPQDPWLFRLSAYDLDIFGPYAFIGGLAVDAQGKQVKVQGVTPGSGIKSVGVQSSSGPFGYYDFFFDLTGKKKDRLTDNEWVEWTTTGLSSIKSFGAHIQGIGPWGILSGWSKATEMPTPVPLPATFWLVASALLGIIGGKRFWRPRMGFSPRPAT